MSKMIRSTLMILEKIVFTLLIAIYCSYSLCSCSTSNKSMKRKLENKVEPFSKKRRLSEEQSCNIDLNTSSKPSGPENMDLNMGYQIDPDEDFDLENNNNNNNNNNDDGNDKQSINDKIDKVGSNSDNNNETNEDFDVEDNNEITEEDKNLAWNYNRYDFLNKLYEFRSSEDSKSAGSWDKNIKNSTIRPILKKIKYNFNKVFSFIIPAIAKIECGFWGNIPSEILDIITLFYDGYLIDKIIAYKILENEKYSHNELEQILKTTFVSNIFILNKEYFRRYIYNFKKYEKKNINEEYLTSNVVFFEINKKKFPAKIFQDIVIDLNKISYSDINDFDENYNNIWDIVSRLQFTNIFILNIKIYYKFRWVDYASNLFYFVKISGTEYDVEDIINTNFFKIVKIGDIQYAVEEINTNFFSLIRDDLLIDPNLFSTIRKLYLVNPNKNKLYIRTINLYHNSMIDLKFKLQN